MLGDAEELGTQLRILLVAGVSWLLDSLPPGGCGGLVAAVAATETSSA